MGLKSDFRLLLKPYYWVNILLSISYLVAKKAPGVCSYLFPRKENECELDSRETEILFFLVIVVMIRTRKTGSVTMINYLTSSFIYTKVANFILWCYGDYLYGIAYAVIFIIAALVLPEPTYAGPENITYFRTEQGLDEELERDKRIVWFVAFFTVWNPACVNFAPIFAELSSDYHLENMRFGKVDIGRFPSVGKKHYVSDSSLSRQLPTIICFKNGKEFLRRPAIDAKGKLQKFFFSKDNIKAAFDLNTVYKECRETGLKPIEQKKTK